MNDYNSIRALYHSELAKRELERQKRSLELLNTDFYNDIPDPIRGVLERLRWDYSNRKWFREAWEEYRKMVLDAGLGGKIKMPGDIFNKYLDKYESKEIEKIYATEAVHSEELGENYVAHAGIKGMKWGIRRYQNEDGTLTAEGKVRYGVGPNGKMSKEGQKKYTSDVNDPKNLKREDISDTTITVAGGVKGATDSLRNIPTKSGGVVRGSYSDLSDAELQKRVNRLNLEQRYSDLVGDTKYVKSGGEKAKEIFQTVGALAGFVAAVTPAVLAVAKHMANRPKRVPKQFRLPAPK